MSVMQWLTAATWLLTAASLVGTILNVKKVKYCFYIWTITNALWLAYDICTGLYSRAALDLVHLALAVWGIRAWRKK